MNRFTYTIVWYCLLPIVFLYLLKRIIKDPQYKRGFWQRLGFIPKQNKPCIHIHCASLGEVNAAAGLIQQLIETYPDFPILVTNSTPAGANRIDALFGTQVLQLMAPIDLPIFVNRFSRKLNSKCSIFTEVEIWPNWLASLTKQQTKLMLVNARLSDKSYRNYAKWGSVFKHAFLRFDWITAQTQNDLENYQKFGVNRVSAVGNLKFDIQLPQTLSQQTLDLMQSHQLNRPIWIAASVHPSEYQIIVQAHLALLKQIPDALLLIAPRHKERFDEVAEYLNSENVNYQRRSRQQAVTQSDHVWLIDSMGELINFYAIADIAFVGGSLVAKGGHNPLEPAALSKPILMGPDRVNCEDICRMLVQAGAMFDVDSAASIETRLMDLFKSENHYHQAALAANKVVMQNQGAVHSSMNHIRNILG